MKNTTYLVTGAAGFLGSNVCRQLLERGEQVRAFVLPNDKAMKYVPKEVEICEGDLCDVRDLAFGCIAAADKGRKGECYILGNEQVTLKQLCEMLHKESGCKKIKFYLPLGFANIIAKSMEKKAKKTGEKPLMTTFSVYNLARNNAFDYSKAHNELGYTTRSYEETIHDEVVWLKAEGKIAL